jgi:hypothetical protein
MMAAYRGRAFGEARERAESLRARVEPQWRDLYGALLERFAALERASPPGDDWTPVWAQGRK